MEPRPGVSKQDIRQQIWDYLESQNLAEFPRPVHHRIPNFKGSHLACQNIRSLDVFARTRSVKVGPDKPLEGVRLLALQSQKMLLVPTPRLRTGLFNKITPPPGATKDILRKCATSQGVRSYSSPVGLESPVLVGLVVVGSVAVSEKGWRIGKGEGYADLEYAMMVAMGAVTPGTPVVTVVHDCQVVDVPEALLEDHDLTVDYIVTPTRVIATGCARPKPTGILWSKISSEMMEKIPVLRSLRYREQRAGKDVTLLVAGSQQPARPSSGRGPRDPPPPEPCSAQQQDGPAADTVRREPSPGRPSERAEESRRRGRRRPPEAHAAGPRRWAPRPVQAPAPAQQAASRLQGLCLGAAGEMVALGGQQRARDLAGGRTGEPECRQAVTDL